MVMMPQAVYELCGGVSGTVEGLWRQVIMTYTGDGKKYWNRIPSLYTRLHAEVLGHISRRLDTFGWDGREERWKIGMPIAVRCALDEVVHEGYVTSGAIAGILAGTRYAVLVLWWCLTEDDLKQRLLMSQESPIKYNVPRESSLAILTDSMGPPETSQDSPVKTSLAFSDNDV